ncbi:hypothetical protein ARMSODRAFT_446861 [Armillaria solidipes]|uniref:Uncharacterized protein n=1 Tax=Armillaria solidipes TaxID=1076256 RepID=A0A2H3B2N9_9AGAR|nr:hypothetical protein ARMSODRAFT_446861 [Armillaria solidipes]
MCSSVYHLGLLILVGVNHIPVLHREVKKRTEKGNEEGHIGHEDVMHKDARATSLGTLESPYMSSVFNGPAHKPALNLIDSGILRK